MTAILENWPVYVLINLWTQSAPLSLLHFPLYPTSIVCLLHIPEKPVLEMYAFLNGYPVLWFYKYLYMYYSWAHCGGTYCTQDVTRLYRLLMYTTYTTYTHWNNFNLKLRSDEKGCYIFKGLFTHKKFCSLHSSWCENFPGEKFVRPPFRSYD